MSAQISPVPGEHLWVSPFLQPLPGKVIQDQVVNYFVVVTGKLIQYRVVKKFIDVYIVKGISRRTKRIERFE